MSTNICFIHFLQDFRDQIRRERMLDNMFRNSTKTIQHQIEDLVTTQYNRFTTTMFPCATLHDMFDVAVGLTCREQSLFTRLGSHCMWSVLCILVLIVNMLLFAQYASIYDESVHQEESEVSPESERKEDVEYYMYSE